MDVDWRRAAMTQAAVVYTWEGSPEHGKPKELGRVHVVRGRAEVDVSIAGTIESVAFRASPDDGQVFVREVVERLTNAPYLWAQLEGEKS